MNPKWVKRSVDHRIYDITKQQLMSEINHNSLCINYRIFKTETCFKNDLIYLTTVDRIHMYRFRCGNHKSPIVKYRLSNGNESAVCPLCTTGDLGDECHYIFNALHLARIEKVSGVSVQTKWKIKYF